MKKVLPQGGYTEADYALMALTTKRGGVKGTTGSIYLIRSDQVDLFLRHYPGYREVEHTFDYSDFLDTDLYH